MTDKVIRITTTADANVGEAFKDLEHARELAQRALDQRTRDLFAAHALPEEMRAASEAIGGEWRPQDFEAVAKAVFDMVDAMMAERARRLNSSAIGVFPGGTDKV